MYRKLFNVLKQTKFKYFNKNYLNLKLTRKNINIRKPFFLYHWSNKILRKDKNLLKLIHPNSIKNMLLQKIFNKKKLYKLKSNIFRYMNHKYLKTVSRSLKYKPKIIKNYKKLRFLIYKKNPKIKNHRINLLLKSKIFKNKIMKLYTKFKVLNLLKCVKNLKHDFKKFNKLYIQKFKLNKQNLIIKQYSFKMFLLNFLKIKSNKKYKQNNQFKKWSKKNVI